MTGVVVVPGGVVGTVTGAVLVTGGVVVTVTAVKKTRLSQLLFPVLGRDRMKPLVILMLLLKTRFRAASSFELNRPAISSLDVGRMMSVVEKKLIELLYTYSQANSPVDEFWVTHWTQTQFSKLPSWLLRQMFLKRPDRVLVVSSEIKNLE